MATPLDTAARFNRISGVYDETRQPLTTEALDKVAAVLLRDGVTRILEAGVGTGRIAVPLQERGLRIVGVDLASEMMAIARAKGIRDLVLADANHLPLREGQFDAALMAHVIHLLENPAETFAGLRRVATKEIVIFVRDRDGGPTSSEGRAGLRDAYRKAAADLGYQVPERPGGWWDGFRREKEFLASHPPTELVTIEDRQVVTTIRERLSFFEGHSFGFQAEIPEEAVRKIRDRVLEALDADKEMVIRRVEKMAIWRLSC
ncbi:MAG: methyltransferase domain-containing protein [Thaumarchaeota archaeon]|nr:methyltransferase domain-containing protein [Nitrososphaerota archaeon]